MSEQTDRADIHVVLVEPEIHWNTGNAGRTCLAAGAQLHLVRPFGFSLDDREVKRAGLDYWPRVQPRLWDSWTDFEAALAGLGPPAFFSPTAGTPFWDADLTAPRTLIFGSETRGLSGQILSDYQSSLFAIPQQMNSVRSLNLSTAVGIAIFEALRQSRLTI